MLSKLTAQENERDGQGAMLNATRRRSNVIITH